MVTALSKLSNPELCKVFNAVTGQTVSRFTSLESGRQRIQRVLKETNTSVEDALDMAGLGEPGSTLAEKEANGEFRSAISTELGTDEPITPMDADLPPTDWTPPAREKASQRPRKARTAKGEAPKREGRLETVLALLRRNGGATVADIMHATGWLPHTTRAYLSKGGAAGRAATIMSEKVERDGKKVTAYSAR